MMTRRDEAALQGLDKRRARLAIDFLAVCRERDPLLCEPITTCYDITEAQVLHHNVYVQCWLEPESYQRHINAVDTECKEN